MPTSSRGIARCTAAASILLTLAACAGAGPAGSPGASSDVGASGNPFGGITVSLAPQSGSPVTGHVGDKLTFATYGGGFEDATLVKVFDPATPTNTNTTLPAGAHWVGVEVAINDLAASQESSVVDATASDGSTLETNDVYQGFSRPIGAFQGCTQTSEDVQPYTHCEAFVVPDGQTLTRVGVKVGGAEINTSLVPNDQATWTVP